MTSPDDRARVDLLDEEKVIGKWPDEKLLKGFEDYNKALYQIWTHIYFLRIVLLYLNTFGRQVAVTRVHEGIANFYGNQTKKFNNEYHFTIVYFWIQVVDFCRNMYNGQTQQTDCESKNENKKIKK